LDTWFASILQELASILIISGAITVISEYFTKREYLLEFYDIERRIKSSILTSENLEHMGNFGVTDCYPDAGRYDFSRFISDSNTLTICVHDGRSWLSANIHPLRDHLMKPSTRTTFLILNPNGNYIPLLADKIGIKTDYQIEKIKDTCYQLIDAYKSLPKPITSSISIYWVNLPIVNTMYISDKMAIIGTFNTSRTKGPMPLLTLSNLDNKNTFYHLINDDLQRLINDPDTIHAFSAKNGKIKVITKEING